MSKDEQPLEIIGPDESMTEEARRWLLRGQGTYPADGLAAKYGYSKVTVKPFGNRGVDVWFYRPDDPDC